MIYRTVLKRSAEYRVYRCADSVCVNMGRIRLRFFLWFLKPQKKMKSHIFSRRGNTVVTSINFSRRPVVQTKRIA